MGFLDSLGAGLRIAGGALDADVYNQQLKQDELAQKTRQAQLATQSDVQIKRDTELLQALQTGSVAAENRPQVIQYLRSRGVVPAGIEIGLNEAAQTREEAVAAKQAEAGKAKQWGITQDALRQLQGTSFTDAEGKQQTFTPEMIGQQLKETAREWGPPELRKTLASQEFAPKEITSSDVGKLLKEQKNYPVGSREYKIYENEIKKKSETTQQINVNVPIPGMNMPIANRDDLHKIGNKFGMTNDAFEQAVKSYKTSGELPATVRSAKTLPLQNAIRNAAAMDDPSLIPSVNKAKFDGYKTTYRQNAIRENGINRATNVVVALEPKVLELSKKINDRLGGQFMNSTLNELSTKFKDDPIAGDIQQLRNMAYSLNREFVVATTMPGSNAQMHTTHSDDAHKLANGDMPINVLVGSLKGINSDIQAVGKSIKIENKRLEGAMSGNFSEIEDIFPSEVAPTPVDAKTSGADSSIEAILKKHGVK